MHQKTSELLGPGDGDGARAVREGLRALPQLTPPPGVWHRVCTAHSRRQRARRVWNAAAGAAVTATAALLAAVGLRISSEPFSRPGIGAAGELRDLVAASGELERVLRTPALQSPVLRPAEAARIVALEDQIAMIDAELGVVGPRPDGHRAVVLWADRVELLGQLVRARTGLEGTGDIVRAVNQNNGREP